MPAAEPKLACRDWLLSTIGKTPLIPLRRLDSALPAAIRAKVEMRNPAASVKRQGRHGWSPRRNAAANCAQGARSSKPPAQQGNRPRRGGRGPRLSLVLTMPETMSTERDAMLRQMGAHVELTEGILMTDARDRASRLARQLPNAITLDQFSHAANPEVHRRTTGPEIWRDIDGSVDAFVSAVGAGGTITGLGETLRRHNPDVLIAAVEPKGAPVMSGG